MSRATVALDRIATFVLAVLLLAAGALGVLWWQGTCVALPRTVNLSPVTRVLSQSWWPWATGVAAVLLALLALRWLAAHLPHSGVGQLVLAGSGRKGRLVTDAGRAADAAAQRLESTLGVRSASGSVQRDRGQLVARLRATIEPDTDLVDVAAAADRVSAELAQMLGREDLRCSVRLTVASRGRRQPRVS